MAVGFHSMHNSSHASEFSSRPHLRLASRRASTDSEYLPSTFFHGAHAQLSSSHLLLLSTLLMLLLQHTAFTAATETRGSHVVNAFPCETLPQLEVRARPAHGCGSHCVTEMSTG